MEAQKLRLIRSDGGSMQKVVGCTHQTKITNELTGGAFSVLVAEVPVNCGPPMHYHEQDSEWAFVLDGEITFANPDGAVVAGPGDSVFLPAGRAHCFSNKGTKTARMLVVITPGVKAHEFFTEVDAKLHGALVPPVLAEIASRHGIAFGTPKAVASKAA
jgi:uncharacterized cupin superfamily protein